MRDTTDRLRSGASVTWWNESMAEISSGPDVDGALVGGASLEPEGFARIVEYRA